MGRIRPSNSATTPEIQRSRIAPPAISLLRRNAEPFINSAITMMLVKRSPSPMPRFQLRTRSSAWGPLRSSDRTFVSNRKLTGRRHAFSSSPEHAASVRSPRRHRRIQVLQRRGHRAPPQSFFWLLARLVLKPPGYARRRRSLLSILPRHPAAAAHFQRVPLPRRASARCCAVVDGVL